MHSTTCFHFSLFSVLKSLAFIRPVCLTIQHPATLCMERFDHAQVLSFLLCTRLTLQTNRWTFFPSVWIYLARARQAPPTVIAYTPNQDFHGKWPARSVKNLQEQPYKWNEVGKLRSLFHPELINKKMKRSPIEWKYEMRRYWHPRKLDCKVFLSFYSTWNGWKSRVRA